jgi:hypothetical protein
MQLLVWKQVKTMSRGFTPNENYLLTNFIYYVNNSKATLFFKSIKKSSFQ